MITNKKMKKRKMIDTSALSAKSEKRLCGCEPGYLKEMAAD